MVSRRVLPRRGGGRVHGMETRVFRILARQVRSAGEPHFGGDHHGHGREIRRGRIVEAFEGGVHGRAASRRGRHYRLVRSGAFARRWLYGAVWGHRPLSGAVSDG